MKVAQESLKNTHCIHDFMGPTYQKSVTRALEAKVQRHCYPQLTNMSRAIKSKYNN